MKKEYEPIKTVLTRLYCDCGTEMESHYIAGLFSLYNFKYICPSCGYKEKGFVAYPMAQYMTEEEWEEYITQG